MLQRSSYRILREVVLILLMKYWSEIIRSQDEFVFFHFKYLFYSGNLHYNILSKITTIPPINLKITILISSSTDQYRAKKAHVQVRGL